jgi:hypothetical protein
MQHEHGHASCTVFSEFRLYGISYVLLIPYIPQSIRNCPNFRGIPYYEIRRIPRNPATFGATKFRTILTLGG